MTLFTRPQILDRLREASGTLGTSFTAKAFATHSGIDYHLVSRLFGSWHEAMLAAGLSPQSSRRTIVRQALIDEVAALATTRNVATITIEEWRAAGSCDDGVIRRRFGSWSAFLEAAGLQVGNRQNIPNDQLLSEFARLHAQLGKPISPNDMDAHGKYSSSTYIRRWGSWSAAWECFQASSYSLPAQNASARSGEQWKARYGEIINIPGLLHAPVNELGVIYLFALVSQRLGFVVEAIRAAFPDALAKRRLPGQAAYELVRIEFEFQSSSFFKHGHDPLGCDLIVCWLHDWKTSPVAVLELKKLLPSLTDPAAALPQAPPEPNAFGAV